MSAPSNEFAFDLKVALAAAERWSRRAHHHERFEEAARNKQYSKLDTAPRLAARANRLMSQLQAEAPEVAEVMAKEMAEEPGAAALTAGAPVTETSVSDAFLERVIGSTRDFQFIEFLEQALYVCKAVGRVVTALDRGRKGYGTGFMASPGLLITNHHVLPNAETASRSKIEFDYQRDRQGQPLKVRTYRLAPEAFFLNDEQLDFTLVAVAPDEDVGLLSQFGMCPLIAEQGKIVAGEPINIIQHPLGELKQVVLRENRLIDALDGADLFLHYEADTEPGSSGSPVFNDQWEVVALHHSGVPRKNRNGDLLDRNGGVWRKGDDPSRLDWVANEGVRASKIVEFVAKARVEPAKQAFVEEFLKAGGNERVPRTPLPPPRPAESTVSLTAEKQGATMHRSPNLAGNFVTLTVPLNITFSLGDFATREDMPPSVPSQDNLGERVVRPESDYKNRPGYDPRFLGFTVPFPKLTNMTRPKAYALPGLTSEGRFELKYHHYSVLFNKERRLSFVAGVNYDPSAPVQLSRDGKDKWYYDPRVLPQAELQAGEDLYAGNPLDRGHLVRRADAAWGDTEEDAKLANDDTFHFTNCSPQHEITNQDLRKRAPADLRLWGGLEKHVAEQGKRGKRKLCVFNGPVFRSNDRVYRGVKLPKEFWKVVVFAKDDGSPGAAAFVLSQAKLLQGLKEEFEVGDYEAVQVRIKDLESKIDLDFGPFRGWDVMEVDGAEENFRGGAPQKVLRVLEDVVL